jgi:hypothetical protein
VAERDPWSRELTTIVGQRIKHYRENFREGRLSARQLSDRCAELGHRVEYQVIANMEARRRTNVTLAELFVLASALKVSPAQLVIPLGEPNNFPVLPGLAVDPWTAYKWFTAAGIAALSALAGPDAPDYVLAIDAYRRHDSALAKLVDKWEDRDTDGYLDSLLNVRAEIRSRGWRLPDLPGEKGFPQSGWPGRVVDVQQAVEAAELERGVS